MPPTPGNTPITPAPAHMPPVQNSTSLGQPAWFVLGIGIIVILGAFAWFAYIGGGVEGTVTLLVRAEDGTRSLSTLDLKSGLLTPQTGGAEVVPRQEFLMNDGTTIQLDTPGIVSRYESEKETTRVLVVSPTPPLPQTPLAVWGQGERVAWVNPADGALQVFEWNGKSYAPLNVFDAAPQSIGFASIDVLVGATLSGSKTVITTYNLKSGKIANSMTLDGLISVVTP